MAENKNNLAIPGIPANPPVASEQARAMTQDAEGIPNGTVPGVVDVTNAMRETKTRKMLNKIQPGLERVSSNEVAQSKIREAAVINAVAAQTYPSAATPAWAIAMKTDLLASIAATVQNSIATLQTNQTNMEIRNFNSQNGACVPLRKVKAGFGAYLPVPAGTIVTALPPHAPPVGTPYPQMFFPTSTLALGEMTHAHIAYLAAWANEDFGIVADDSLPARRRKFGQFITNNHVELNAQQGV